MIYFDNAATGGFKPRAVFDATETVIKYLSANPGRSGHRLSVTGAEIVYNCRTLLSKFFNSSPERVIFTKNCTEALNLAIFGTLKKGGHIITTVYEHNSVLRPLFYLQQQGLIELDIVYENSENILKGIKEKIKSNTYLVVTTALSNVTGESLDIKNIGNLCAENGIKYLVDGAQGGGHIPISLKEDNISMLALAGHKGLYGIMGSGILLFDEKTEISPLLFGGTGTESFNTNQPATYPEKLEAGTLNLPAISALLEGAKYSLGNITNFNETLKKQTEKIIYELKKIGGIKIYSPINPAGIVSFELPNMSSTEVADILNSRFDIAVRGGLHCSPLIHKFLNTEKNGLIRISLAVFNSNNEINFFLSAIKEILRG